MYLFPFSFIPFAIPHPCFVSTARKAASDVLIALRNLSNHDLYDLYDLYPSLLIRNSMHINIHLLDGPRSTPCTHISLLLLLPEDRMTETFIQSPFCQEKKHAMRVVITAHSLGLGVLFPERNQGRSKMFDTARRDLLPPLQLLLQRAPIATPHP